MQLSVSAEATHRNIDLKKKKKENKYLNSWKESKQAQSSKASCHRGHAAHVSCVKGDWDPAAWQGSLLSQLQVPPLGLFLLLLTLDSLILYIVYYNFIFKKQSILKHLLVTY